MSRRQTISPALRREVIARWGDECWLGLPGCTGRGEEDDHIIPWSHGGRDTVSNIRRACKHCNASRSDRNVNRYPATYHVVIGPPCAGKTEYALDNARADSIIIDHGQLTQALLMPDMRDMPAPAPDVVQTANGAWHGALRRAERIATPSDIWIIKCIPALPRHPHLLDEWIALGYDVRVIDPGRDETMRRIQLADNLTPGLVKAARQWYGLHLTARHVDKLVDARQLELERLGLASARTTLPPDSIGGW